MRNDSIAAALCAALLIPLPAGAAPVQPQNPDTARASTASVPTKNPGAAKTPAAASQKNPAQPATAPAPLTAVSDTVAVPVWPKAAVTLPVNQPTPASFSLGTVEGINPALLSGVTAKGYARKVEAGPQTVGQVLVTSVTKGDREETISAEGLTAQFDAKGANELFPEKTLEVKGSKSALVAALERLAKKEKNEKKEEETKKSQSESTVRQGSSGSRSNDLASQYRTPTTIASTPTSDKQTTTEIRTSTEGCHVRVNLAQGKAIRQSKEQTFTDGVLSGESQCSDSEVSFPLKKSYASCPTDIVDLNALKAWPQYSLIYTDEAGETHAVSECTKDTESPYVLTEDESQCAVSLDFTTARAVPQAALVYLNRNNAPVQARGCAPSTKSAAVKMTESVDACPLRHDFAAGKSTERSMWTYVLGGITHQAAPCADTGRTFPHETVHTDSSGSYICPTITDPNRRTVTLQSRQRITIDGVARYISECTPDKRTTTETRTSTEGCRIRVDLAQGKAIRQSKEQTFTDGVLSGESQCRDSEVSFPLKKSYASCTTDIVDLTALKAWPQYSLIYTDDAGETHTASECAKDEETPYAISEDESQCAVFLDFTTAKAVPQAALVYLNRNNASVQARGCAPSTKSAALPMTESVEACPLRHDFAANKSAELSMWTYIRDGVTYQAAPCADTGRTFSHETVYADASGNYVCPTVTDLDRRAVTLQSRKQITIDGGVRYITECSPDSAAQAIISTTEGCTDPTKWTHDIEAGQSYGQERFYYTRPNGSREYVTACQTSATTYRQQQTITGYQNHDDQLWAYPLSTVTIDYAGKPYTIVASQVLPGAAQLAYLPQGTTDFPTGSSTYEGCNAWRQTARSEHWKRPDDTEYTKPIGAGTPVGPVNVCIEHVVETRPMATGWYGLTRENSETTWGNDGANSPTTTVFNFCTAMQNVHKIERINTDTGEKISTTCKFPGNAWIGWCEAAKVTSRQPFPAAEPYIHSIGGTAISLTERKQTLFVPPCPF
ncbi:hypothetical protein [Magnetospirillum molischianum]|uniref:Secreted protein n=1 Tax=Magnetospirillum molischianum DSM 120 TaxID=1150626 RepID=H8FVU8_MAGML|nr:hypothetical protein [Magnetospirillum molischianum]CCG42486.1 exported hypothetical protein [Magnetospirillum molischianum DSM 120]